MKRETRSGPWPRSSFRSTRNSSTQASRPLRQARAAKAQRRGAKVGGRTALQSWIPMRRRIKPPAGHQRETPRKDAEAPTSSTRLAPPWLPGKAEKGGVIRLKRIYNF
jgi:hypothetical protein